MLQLTSDHVPLKLILAVLYKRNKRQFRFEKMWIRTEGIEEVIMRGRIIWKYYTTEMRDKQLSGNKLEIKEEIIGEERDNPRAKLLELNEIIKKEL